jgi:ATP-dependent RNA helicase DeaD
LRLDFLRKQRLFTAFVHKEPGISSEPLFNVNDQQEDKMNSFLEMSLAPELQSALQALQFSSPKDIQKAVIPAALAGRDIIACAETGSGKTAAYGIPLVAHLLEGPGKTALVLAPTRELVSQIADFLHSLTKDCHGLQTVAIVGGADIRRQLVQLKRNPRIVVATPGRLIDHLKRKSLKLDSTAVLVLDEGDRMLDMGFAPQLNQILKFLPRERQTLLFTATLPDRVRELAGRYLRQPERINVGRTSLPVASIKQSVVELTSKEKDMRLVDELNLRGGAVIVFVRTKRRADKLARFLAEYNFSVSLIHGGRTHGQRNRALDMFRSGRSRILCATDIAARGIDVSGVQHVINFDLPMMDEDYVHRIGRTGRNGASGEAISFVTPEDRRAWQALARKYQIGGAHASLAQPKTAEKPKTQHSGFQKKSQPKKKSGTDHKRRRSHHTPRSY